jgi:glycosyltransferase involved in cell wall biosynthesis
MKVAIFHECYLPVLNGVTISVNTLTMELRKMGDIVWIFAPAYTGYQDEDENVVRFPSFRFPFQKADYPLGVPFSAQARRVLDREGFDLIHVNSPFTMSRYGAGAARRLGIPFVVTYHTLLEEYAHYALLPPTMGRWLMRKISRDFCNRADCVVAPTNVIRKFLLGYGVTKRIEVIPTGIQDDKRPSADPSWVRGKYGIPPQAPLLVNVGRLAKEKNTDFLLRAFQLVLRRQPEAWLMLVGSGPWKDYARSLADELGLSARVVWAGFVPKEQVMDHYASADMYVHAATTDTQALTLVEAMLCGVPAVVVDAYGPAEIVRDTGGGLVTKIQEADFADNILRMIQDKKLHQELAEKARSGSQCFRAPVCAARMKALYEEVTAGSGY